MPAIRAASWFDDAQRIAMPIRLRLRNTTSASTRTGAKNSIAEFDGVMRSAPSSKEGRPGGSGNRSAAAEYTTALRTTRNCPTPSVATMLISRGARRNRRTTATSAPAATAPPRTIARGNAT
jgi:hypothetical protein